MIVEWWVETIGGWLRAVAEFLPDWELPAVTGGTFAIALTFDSLLPVHELVQVAGMLVALQVWLIFYRVIRIVMSHIPFVGGSG